MLIRTIPPAERLALAPLFGAYAAEMQATLAGTATATGEQAAALLAADTKVELFAAFDDAAPIGFAVLLDLPEMVFARRCGALDDLFVAPAHRGRGVARAIIAALCEEGRARGWSHLRWIVPAADTAAIALYRRIASRADWLSFVIRLDPRASL